MRRCWFGLLLVVLPTWLLAAKTRVWTQGGPGAFDKAQLEGLVVTSTGELRLARRLKSLPEFTAAHVWGLAASPDRFFAGTGGEGKLFRVPLEGPAEELYDGSDSQILCLARSAEGTLYAGTGPSGKILRITAAGQASEWCSTGAGYVWSLVLDEAQGALFAGTGPHGRILRVALDSGQPTVFHETGQDHVLALARGQEPGTLFAGTGKRGLVLRIDAAGRGQVWFDAPQPEVRTLLATDQAVFAGTSAAGGKDNAVYRLDGPGVARELYKTKAMVLCLAARHQQILIGTGTPAQIIELDPRDGAYVDLARLDQGQVLGLLPTAHGVAVATGDPGRLFLLDDRPTRQGTMLSEVFDAKLASHWGALRWTGELPPGTSVRVSARSGNVARPDATWSPWSEEQSDVESARIAVPAARFLQLRLTLSVAPEAAALPSIRSLSLRYRQVNVAPVVSALELPDLDAGTSDQPKRLKLKWTATDANDDDLTFALHLRKDGWPDWLELAADLDKREWEWDTTAVPSGVYRLRVTASDRPSNHESEALIGQRLSPPFVIDHVPPHVQAQATVTGRAATVEVTVQDEHSRIAAVSAALDGKKWQPIFPADGLFDAKRKSVTIRWVQLAPGPHVAVIRATDAAGNVGVGDVQFVVPLEPPGP